MKALIDQAIDALRKGRIIIMPTDTIPGLAVDARNPEAVEKLYTLKQRVTTKPFILQIGKLEQLNDLVEPVDSNQRELLHQYWPGKVTFIFRKKASITLPYQNDTIAIRIPDDKAALDLLCRYGCPLSVTSINDSGANSAKMMSDIPECILSNVEVILPLDNQSTLSQASTIVSLLKAPYEILRQGEIKFPTLSSRIEQKDL